MAANDIIYIPNQPVVFHKVAPTEQEQALGMRPWSQAAYHNRLGNCGFYGPKYCHPYSINEADVITFQFKAATTGDNLVTPLFTPIFSDANTSVVADQLVDSGATFQTSVPDAETGMFVLNTTTPGSSVITNVASETELELFDNIFLATPEDYEVYAIKAAVNWHWNPTTDIFYVESAAVSGITFEDVLTVGNWYKITITVVDITAGELNIKLGSNIIATITSVGTHVVYGKCLTTDDFVIDPEDFIGEISTDIDVRQLETSYTIIFFDLDGNVIETDPHVEDSDSLTIGNVIYVQNIAAFPGLTCGNYVLGIGVGDGFCSGNMVQNGDFSSATGWTLNDNVTIEAGINPHLQLDDAEEGIAARNTLLCSIRAGHSYTMTWEVGPVIDEPNFDQYGTYHISIFGADVSPVYDAATQTNVSLTFTAPNDSDLLYFIVDTLSKFTVDNVTLVDNTYALFSDMDGLSECLCICDEQPCTTLIRFFSDRPTYGNYFDDTVNNVEMYMRVQGRLRNLDPVDLELNSFKNTLDNQEQVYANLQDAEEFATSHVPEWVHGSLRVALSHPSLYINLVSYKRIGNYTPNWTDDSEMCSAVCPVAKTNQGSLRNNF